MSGVHPAYNKLTRRAKIEILNKPKKVIIPLTQHIGAPNEPIVKVGDEVKTGQLIARNDSFVSSHVHASISGKVIDISDRFTSLGTRAPCMTILSDGLDDWVDLKPLKDLPADEKISKLKEMGIVGLGGATFPTHVKLSPPKDKKVDMIIVNGAECEPYLTCDNRVMIEKGENIIRALVEIMELTGCKKATVGIEKNKPNAIKNIKKMSKKEFGIGVYQLPQLYPQGAEKVLINTITNRWVPPGKLPIDLGVVVLNVGTLNAIYEAIFEGKPLIQRIVTVTGAVREKKNASVRLGTTFQDVIIECGGTLGEPKKIVSGGPMMGISQSTDDVPVMKGTSGILVMDEFLEDEFTESPCIKCARCVDACPMNLLPLFIARNSKLGNYDICRNLHALDCFECGCCAFSCPSKIPLVQLIKDSKVRLNRK